MLCSFHFILYVDKEHPFSFLLFSKSMKQESMDNDFVAKKKVLKRKRIKDEPIDGVTLSPTHV